MIGESFTLVMAPTGEVQKVEGLSKLAEKMFKNIPQDPATAGILDGLKANLSDDAMRSQFTQTFAQFPNRPLKSGDTWNSSGRHHQPHVGRADHVGDVDAEGGGRRGQQPGGDDCDQSDRQAGCQRSPRGANPMGLTMQMGDGTGDGEQVFDAGSGRLRRLGRSDSRSR